ncbi:phosphoribosyltransferase [Sphingomonas sp. Leaf33]|uniref:phosphoribosyltransferase n=1 Tax=Sphingomonas sp. Leaf33 TaxID=1736215 RepID=UPI0006F5EE99|nr:phosphoribosyltransferase family protein [Sphingomonas sp. Leaf33]KQN26453.1 phosphoribosyltransferase [Sphingomonas sp. Leaf33]
MTAPTLTPITHDDFLQSVAALVDTLRADDWQAQLLVGVGRGGLVPAVFLSHATGLPMVSIDFSTPIPEFNAALIATLAKRTRDGERMVFVEDINDSGRTIAAIREQLGTEGADAANVRFAVMVDNTVSGQRIDYSWRRIDRTVTKDWFVFPWEAVGPHAAILDDAAEVPERIA